MYLQKLSLINFKNFHEVEIEFSEKINCFVGNNGMGKTNLLDAIYYLSFCKSYFNLMDSQNIKHNESFFVVQGTYVKDDNSENVYCGLKLNQKKQFKLNKKEYSRLADHVGYFPLVIVSPDDSEIITGGSEIRRKFVDSIISQYDKVYLDNLINYNKLIFQRNNLLKRFAESKSYNKENLEIWDEQIVPLGNEIYKKRSEFVNDFKPVFEKHYKFISLNNEKVELEYNSQLKGNDFKVLLNENIGKDRMLQYTSTGIHKDDLIFMFDGFPVKKFGSQGQQKSFIIALKLAQFDLLAEIKKFKPVILFDDVFDKLDHLRVEQIIKLVSDNNFGQIFITDTEIQRIQNVFEKVKSEHKIFNVDNGAIAMSNI
ncbi:MAG: DNA replication and repair protein RecF [Bacteroidales bacterium]|jgi:DNA replication and repair protein RecF